MSKKRFTVKVQVDFTRRKMLIYNKSRSLTCEGPVTDDTLVIMEGDFKRFFHATLVGSRFQLWTRVARDPGW